MDGGAWWAAVHGVAKSQTWLSDFTFTFHFHALEKEMATHSSVLAWRIPGTGEPGGLSSMGSHRVGHDWSNLAAAAAEESKWSQTLRPYLEAPILWPSDVKNWLIGKDPDVGIFWRQEERWTTEDEMVGWHHWLNGHESEQAPGVGDRQGAWQAAVHGVTKSQMWLRDWTELRRKGEWKKRKRITWDEQNRFVPQVPLFKETTPLLFLVV